jgi:hypothetical protein
MVAPLKQLARTILRDTDPNARKEALLEIRRYDHPKIMDVLERAATQDNDASVRHLAKHLLTKKHIELELSTDSVLSNSAAAPYRTPSRLAVPHTTQAAAPVDYEDDLWTCPNCGGGNDLSRGKCVYCGTAQPSDTGVSAATGAAGTEEGAVTGKATYAAFVKEAYLFNKQNRAFLAGKRKRPVDAGESSGYTALFAFVLLIALGFITAGFGFAKMNRYNALNANGVIATGQVTYVSTFVYDESYSHRVYYEFTTANGRVMRQGQDMRLSNFNAIIVGTQIQVRYDPSNPSNAIIVGTDKDSISDYIIILAFAAVWIIGTLVGTYNSMLKRSKLARRGVVLPGRIVQVKTDIDSEYGSFSIRVFYQVHTADDRWVDGQYSSIRNDLRKAPMPAPGRTIAVLYADERTHQPL